MNTEWTLFGLDLSRLLERLKLGLEQLLHGEEFGLRGQFYPSATLLNSDAAAADSFAKFVSVSESKAASEHQALLLPYDMTLAKSIELPVDAEVDLSAAVSFEVLSNSPFASEDTCFGWRIVDRDPDKFIVNLVIASRFAVQSFCQEQLGAAAAPNSVCEVWAQSEERLVQLVGFDDMSRSKAYIQRLGAELKKILLLATGVSMLLAMPAAMLSIRSNQLDTILQATESEAQSATLARNQLVSLEERVAVAQDFFAQRKSYDYWLNVVANMTPDSVYLTRLALEEDRLTLSGMASNAAEYQTTLAGSGMVSDLSAPSAFTRDSRTGLERFTLTMRLGGER